MKIPTVDDVVRPKAHGYDGYIDNILIRLAVSPDTPLEDVTAEATAPRIDTSELAEDVRDEVGRRYSRSNLSGGAGLDFLHGPNRPEDAALRFWDSKGVDVFATDRGDVYEATLMHAVEEHTSDSGIIDVAQIDGTVYYLNASGVSQRGVGQKAAITGLQLVAMGNSLYVRTASGVNRYDPYVSWTPTSISSTTYDHIWPAKERIMGVVNNSVYDLDDETTPVDTLPTAETVTAIVDVGPAVLIFGTTGFVRALALSDASSLVPAGRTKFLDEVPIMAVESGDVIGIVTAEVTEAGGRVARFYTASIGLSGNYTLESRQLIFQRGTRATTDDLTPHAMYASRDSIYVAIPEEGSTEITLWRYYLPTGGYARAHSIDPGEIRNISSLVEVDDRMWFAIPDEGLWYETDDYVISGYVIGPLADFFTADEKQWVAGELSGASLPQGCALELYDTTNPALINQPDSGSWTLVTQLLATQTRNNVNTLTGRNARYHAGQIVLRSDSTRTFSPGFRSYSFRALPNPTRDILLRIPINVSDQIESPRRRAITIPGRGRFVEQALREYEGRHVLIELYRPSLQVRGLIEKFESVIETISPLGSTRRVLYARVRGTRLQDSEAIVVKTSGASLGQDILGIVAIGTGEVNE